MCWIDGTATLKILVRNFTANHILLVLMRDNSGEYKSEDTMQFLESNGIRSHVSKPRKLWQNGAAANQQSTLSWLYQLYSNSNVCWTIRQCNPAVNKFKMKQVACITGIYQVYTSMGLWIDFPGICLVCTRYIPWKLTLVYTRYIPGINQVWKHAGYLVYTWYIPPILRTLV